MPGRILIVDDVITNIRLLAAKLQSEYYEILSADNGYTAIELAKTGSPDLILLDVMMPGMDGFTVCQRLKADPDTAHIPVVIVTALSDTADRVYGLEIGADDFLTKPVRDIPLFARVRSLVRLKLLMDVWRVREETTARLKLDNLASLESLDSGPNGRILVIEESDYDARMLAQSLAESGYEVMTSLTPEEGLKLLIEQSFDLVLIALRHGENDNLRLCSQIRSHTKEDLRSLPILLMADDDQDITLLAKGLDLGVNDYVIKPIDLQELRARTRTQVRRQRLQQKLRSSFENSVSMVLSDPLTGVYNRRYFDANLEHLVNRSRIANKPLSLAFCDIDHFKLFNDTYGHAAGDEVLIEFSKRLQANTRSLEQIARLGGEEFVVVMPDAAQDQALAIGERLRACIAETPFHLSDRSEIIPVTISVGVATLSPGDANGQALLKRADEAMYQAKHGGRNRVTAAREDFG